ncbi:MarR family winged helix-turn-helix transcriptional regulator [Deinococcus yavapaiensis]|uniref:DNA-binding MarR family transcriptional regulator n=1 Tax=Deinococcus yavapaiensis KR-236 TaxID=694435 RepID=A0A318S2N5_9DEIO|nr:MarR family transcriptional regulator [Deinococcus yavapaiensis]PYE49918.1 DNA-binding MarR family transcriptional regulator [Deinococcus yavapaiensis KR-236]
MGEESTTRHDSRAERRALLVWTLLARTYHHALQEIEATLLDHGLTVMEFDVLAHIDARSGLTQQELAGRLLVTKGNVTYQLTKLEGQHLIERHVTKRCNHLHLTPRGRQVVHDAVVSLKALHTRQFAHLTPEEQRQLTALLRKATSAPSSAHDNATSPHAPLIEV